MRTLTLPTHHSFAANRGVAKATLPRERGQTALVRVAALAACVSLAACGVEKPAQGVIGYVSGFAGFISAEEPRAVLVGEDVLSAGGTAADAATAVAATLTVTLPSRAGWMGGGVCLSRMPKDQSVKTFVFQPQPLPGGGFAPGMPRGLYALHAASGVMRWETILAPAENLARFGTPVSRAFAKDLEALGSPAALGDDVRAVFTRKDGTLLREGDNLLQLRASTLMTSLRMKGAGEAYAGALARLIAAAVPDRAEERRAALRAYRVTQPAPTTAEVGNEIAYFPPAPFAGPRAAQAWIAAGAAESAKPARIAGAEPSVPGYGSTGFVVVDRGGMTVACTLSMGRMFGAGQTLGDTGLLAYAPLDGTDLDADSMLPMFVGNRHVHDLRVAAAGAGSTAVPDVLDFAARARFGEENAHAASDEAAAAGAADSRVTGVSCPDGAPSHVANCTLAVDPRGAGVSRAIGRDLSKSGAKVLFQ